MNIEIYKTSSKNFRLKPTYNRQIREIQACLFSPEEEEEEERKMKVEEMKILSNSVEVSAMNFSYEGQIPIFANFSLKITPGSRCLLVGANGSGNLPDYLFVITYFPNYSVYAFVG